MASKTDIANLALSHLGEPPILSLTEDNKAARTMNLWFNFSRDALLRAHPWNFATRRAALALLGTPPAFGFARAFALPSDFLRLAETNETFESNYRMESVNGVRAIVTNDITMNLKYVARITNSAQFDELFVIALSSRLAFDSAMAITNDRNERASMKQIYLDHLAEARSVDAQEDPAKLILVEDFIDARQGAGDFRPIEPIP